MLPSWPVIGNLLKSYQWPESKQVKLMVKSISGYRTHTKKCRYCRMASLHNIYFLCQRVYFEYGAAIDLVYTKNQLISYLNDKK